jgi:hypothetical protein
MRLASMPQEASSGIPPLASTRPSAAQAASKPAAPAALPSTRRACLLPALSSRSMASTSARGMSSPMADSPKARGLATGAGMGGGRGP